SDEDAITVARRKLLLVVPHHCIRRPMGWKDGNGSNLARAYADRFAAVATVFGRQNQLFQERVVVALGPAIVSLGLQKQHLFSRQRRLLIGFEMLLLKPKDRKSTRLNSSHVAISYAVFCLKKKKK